MQTSFYESFKVDKLYSEELQGCIERTVNQLSKYPTDVGRPGMLLGNIQSGKTRAFIGIIAKAFDNNFDIAIILTKGTKALAQQTVQRLENEFDDFIENDQVKVYDIMSIPKDLDEYVLNQRLIIVVKKEDDNLRWLDDLFNYTYPILGDKKTIIIDDEADFASVGYRKVKKDDGETEMTYNVLARQISNFRSSLSKNSHFLQVTATPYSLYLQPEEIIINGSVFEPVKPAFTEIVPDHSLYVGAKYYFEDALDNQSPAFYLHYEIEEDELKYLAKTHGTIRNNVLYSPKIKHFRYSLITYLVAGAIRQAQIRNTGSDKVYKSSFIIHTEIGRIKHENQFDLTKAIIASFKNLFVSDPETFSQFIKDSYNDLTNSVRLTKFYLPSFEEVLDIVKMAPSRALVRKINSDSDVMSLLNHKTGELKLDSVYNIFIGGQILDRGITIQNLIGFFYGRNPNKLQQDTVMQHSRMYGARTQEDMAVTRLYTTSRLHLAMKKMYEFDKALRAFFENKENDKSVVFIQRDSHGKIIPCNPNKIQVSNTITISKHSRLLPVGFQTKSFTDIHKTVDKIEQQLRLWSSNNFNEPFEINFEDAVTIIKEIGTTYSEKDQDDNVIWNTEDFIASLSYMTGQTEKVNPKSKLFCIVKLNREIKRKKEEDRAFTDAPDSGNIEGLEARKISKDRPCLILLKQTGRKDNGWKDAEFWWPVLYSQENIKTCIYAIDQLEE